LQEIEPGPDGTTLRRKISIYAVIPAKAGMTEFLLMVI
jgi:hypothetical protein